MEVEETQAEPPPKEEYLFKVLEESEYNEINENVRSKLETAIQGRINEFIVQEALHQTAKTEYGKYLNQGLKK